MELNPNRSISKERRVVQLLEIFLEELQAGNHPNPELLAERLAVGSERNEFLELAYEYVPLVHDCSNPGVQQDFGAYRLDYEIGRGSYGIVYAARDAEGQEVAVKVLYEELALRAEIVARFQQESMILDGLDHPYIVRVLDHGIEGLKHYIVMERMNDGTLADRIRERNDSDKRPRGEADIRAGCDVVRKISEAVDYLHARGLVHRDIKPENILFDAHGEPKLGDFGFARSLASQTLTEREIRLGAPAYMAPEWELRPWEAREDPKVDIYSLGITLYEVVAGARPFQGTTTQMLRSVKIGPPKIWHFLNGQGLSWLGAIIEKAVAFRPSQRYSSAAALANDLGRWLDSRKPVASRTAWIRRALRLPKAQPRIATAVSALLVALLVVSIWQVNSMAKSKTLSLHLVGAHGRLTSVISTINRIEGLVDMTDGVEDDLNEGERASLLMEQRDYIKNLLFTLRLDLASLESLVSDSEKDRALYFDFHVAQARWHELEGEFESAEREWSLARQFHDGIEEFPPTCEFNLSTNPPNASVRLFRYGTNAKGVWPEEPVFEESIQSTPIHLQALEPGSYVIELQRADGQRVIRYPFFLKRGERQEVESLWLPSDDEIGEGWVYIPPGKFISGSYGIAINGSARAIRYQEGFFIMENELIIEDYFDFLRSHDIHTTTDLTYCDVFPGNARGLCLWKYGTTMHQHVVNLWERHRFVDSVISLAIGIRELTEFGEGIYGKLKRERHLPRASSHRDAPLMSFEDLLDPTPATSTLGYFDPENVIHSISLDTVKCFVNWINRSKRAYDDPWHYSLPSQWEWEKAARGTDGRAFPWGSEFDPRFVVAVINPDYKELCNNMIPKQIQADCSPYQVYDMTGNVREFVDFAGPLESDKMLCGGEQQFREPGSFMSAARSYTYGGSCNWDYGFRLCRRRTAPGVQNQ